MEITRFGLTKETEDAYRIYRSRMKDIFGWRMKSECDNECPERKENQKKEASRRLGYLHLAPNIRKEFDKNQTLYKSQYGKAPCLLNEGERDFVSQFEKKMGATVYHVYTWTNAWTSRPFIALFFVTSEHKGLLWKSDEDFWKLERRFAIKRKNRRQKILSCYVQWLGEKDDYSYKLDFEKGEISDNYISMYEEGSIHFNNPRTP